MRRDDVVTRYEGRRPISGPVAAVLAVCGVLLIACAVLEFGALLSTGQPAPGGLNPVAVVLSFLQAGAPWTWGHWLAVALLIGLVLGGVFGVARLRRRRTKDVARGDHKARYMGSAAAFTEAAVREHAQEAQLSTDGIVGLPVAQVVRTDKWMWAGFRDGMIAIMGPGSGKTSAQVVTGALDAPGPCWVTSNKPDAVAALWSSRLIGRTLVFDPQQIANSAADFYYDPLSFIRAGLVRRRLADGTDVELDQRLTRAVELADQFADSSRAPGAETDAFFDPASRALLASLLLAAAIENLPLVQVLEWTYQVQNRLPRDILRQHGLATSSRQVEGVQGLYEETRGSIYQGASTILRFVADTSAHPWIQRMGEYDERPAFDPARYVRSDDLMICLSREGVGSFGPVVAAMTTAVIRAAEQYAAEQGGRLPVPLVMQLDEVANVCRIQQLPDLVSHVGSRGIFIAPYLQSPGQGRAAWGEDGWDKLFGASVIRIIGRGLIDMKFLKDISDAVGPQPVVRYQKGSSTGGRGVLAGGGSSSLNEHLTTEAILDASELAALPQWRALAVCSGERPALLRLVPWFDRPEMADRVRRSREAFLALRPQLAADIAAAERLDEGAPEPIALDA